MNDASRPHDLLNLPGLRVTKVTETETQYTVLVEVVPSRPEPCCLLQPVSLRRNGTKRQLFRDMPIHGRFTDIQVDRQRYHCKECDMPRGISTLSIIGLETDDEPISTQLSE